MNFERLQPYAWPAVRISFALVILWFGAMQLINTQEWIFWLPQWAQDLGGDLPTYLVLANGAFEVLFGGLLLLGKWTRWSALLLELHTLGITVELLIGGQYDIALRDFGLAMMGMAVFMAGPDQWCLDSKAKTESAEQQQPSA